MKAIISIYRAAFAGLPRAVWVLCLVGLINRSGTMVLPFLSLYLTRELGRSTVEAGGVLALYGVGAVVGNYLGGWLSDRLGPRRVQELSLGLAGALFLVLSQLRGLVGICVAVVLLSTAAESFRPANLAAIAAASPAAVRTRALALQRLAINLGMAIGPTVGGFLALVRYDLLFVADAVTCWLAAAVVRDGFEAGPAAEMSGKTIEEPRRGRSPLRDGPFLLLMALVFGVALIFIQVFSTWPLYLSQRLGLLESEIGLLFGLNTVLIVMFEMVLVQAVQHRRHTAVAAWGALLVAAGFALLPYGSAAWFAALTVVVWTTGEMLLFPMLNAVVAERADPGSRGRYMGLFGVTFSLAWAVGPVAGTFVYERLSPEALWHGAGLLGALVWAAFAPVSRLLERRRTRH